MHLQICISTVVERVWGYISPSQAQVSSDHLFQCFYSYPTHCFRLGLLFTGGQQVKGGCGGLYRFLSWHNISIHRTSSLYKALLVYF